MYWLEPSWIKVTRVPIAVPPGMGISQPIKIVHLSDLHLQSQPHLVKILQSIQEQDPDLIVLTGDFIEHPKWMPAVLEFVSRFPVVPVFSVLGNWEHWGKINIREYRRQLQARKIKLLVNECQSVTLRGQNLIIAGVDDPGTWYDDLPKTLKACPKQKGYKILLSHSPWIMKEKETAQFPLALAGHCHGGQMRLPFVGPLWLPRGCSRDAYYGLIQKGPTQWYVTSGLGTSILPFRFWSRPEIAVIELRPQSGDNTQS